MKNNNLAKDEKFVKFITDFYNYRKAYFKKAIELQEDGDGISNYGTIFLEYDEEKSQSFFGDYTWQFGDINNVLDYVNLLKPVTTQTFYIHYGDQEVSIVNEPTGDDEQLVIKAVGYIWDVRFIYGEISDRPVILYQYLDEQKNDDGTYTVYEDTPFTKQVEFYLCQRFLLY